MTALLTDALHAFGLDGAEAVFLRHNENLTYRVADKYLLRIHQAAEGLCIEHSHPLREAELAFLRHLREQGVLVQQPVGAITLNDGTMATLLTWLDGEALTQATFDEAQQRRIGQMTAQLHHAAQGFTHPGLRCYDAGFYLSMADELDAMAVRASLGGGHAAVFRAACQEVAKAIGASANLAIHADLSHGNILLTPNGFAPIDFSLCGVGHPMHDLGILLGNLSTQAQRQAVAAGYTEAGGQLDLPLLDAGFALGLLEALVLHAERWFREDWFAPRMTRWTNETLAPLAAGKPLLDETMFLINLK